MALLSWIHVSIRHALFPILPVTTCSVSYELVYLVSSAFKSQFTLDSVCARVAWRLRKLAIVDDCIQMVGTLKTDSVDWVVERST